MTDKQVRVWLDDTPPGVDVEVPGVLGTFKNKRWRKAEDGVDYPKDVFQSRDAPNSGSDDDDDSTSAASATPASATAPSSATTASPSGSGGVSTRTTPTSTTTAAAVVLGTPNKDRDQ